MYQSVNFENHIYICKQTFINLIPVSYHNSLRTDRTQYHVPEYSCCHSSHITHKACIRQEFKFRFSSTFHLTLFHKGVLKCQPLALQATLILSENTFDMQWGSSYKTLTISLQKAPFYSSKKNWTALIFVFQKKKGGGANAVVCTYYTAKSRQGNFKN